MSDFEYVIVGGGVAGCIVARRLADAGRRIALIEAGRDYGRAGTYPARLEAPQTLAIQDLRAEYSWTYEAQLHSGVRSAVPRGRILGGSSAINGSQYLRPTRSNLDSWSCLGLEQWSYAEVLPYMIAAETDLDFGSEAYHGHVGPVEIQRGAAELTPHASAFAGACDEVGYSWAEDLNAPDASGVGRIPLTMVDGRRQNIANAYLPPALRPPTLTVIDQTAVLRIMFDRGRAYGVEVSGSPDSRIVRGENILVCAGALNSPHLLTVSGIGDAHRLRALDIPVVYDLPAVGRGAVDHPGVWIAYDIDKVEALPSMPSAQVTLVFDSEVAGGRADLRIFPATHPRNGSSDALALCCSLGIEDSRGEVIVRSADPRVPPELDLRYLTSGTDAERLGVAVRRAVQLLERPAFQSLGARLRDLPPADLRCDDRLGQWIRSHLSTSYHTAGTCRMGLPDDPTSVVDERCSVRGVERLYVIDLSVLPCQSSRGTFATTVAIAERAAANLLAQKTR